MKRLYIYCFILFYISSVHADYGYLPAVSSFVEQAEAETKKHFDDEVLQKLYEYRVKIRESAYAVTMQLCAGYRTAVGYGMPEYHENMRKPYYTNHSDPEVRLWAGRINEEYGKAVSSSLQAWMKLVYEGGAQPFSVIFGGLKSDYLAKRNTGLFEFESWFHSLYSLFLLDSLGFLQGAVHCLGTHDKSEIDRFAAAVMIVDSEAGLAGHLITFWTGAVILKYIWLAARWTFRPVGKMTKIYRQRFTKAVDDWLSYRPSAAAVQTRRQLPLLTQTLKYLSLSGIAGASGLYVYHLIDEKNQTQSGVMEEMRSDLAQERHWGQVGRAVLFSQAVQVFFPLYRKFKKGEINEAECWECLDVFDPFYQFLDENFDKETWSLIEQDYLQLKEKEEIVDYRLQNYFNLLDRFLPILEGFYSENRV